MAQHTWFSRDKKIYDKIVSIEKRIEDHENDLKFLDDLEIYQLRSELSDLHKKGDTEFHDCFRTSKRESDGDYCKDVIYSEVECDKWLDENKETVYQIDKVRLSQFWKKYPNGVIYFG